MSFELSSDYRQWLQQLKSQFQHTQQNAVRAVNTEMLKFYWQLGEQIVEQQQNYAWGDGFLKQLSHDLMMEFPEMKGFSKRNLEYIRRWYLFWSKDMSIAQQVVAQLGQIPWGHHTTILDKCKDIEIAKFYLQSSLQYGWSRAVLTHQIESQLWQRQGSSIDNFVNTLPTVQSDLAKQTLKDPYSFDFLSLSPEHNERQLEQGLIENITQFLLELGTGFAYVGKQVPLQVGQRDFYLDLLFYHTKLHCYVVIELKVVEFEPEHIGKLNFYIKAVDEQIKTEYDQPTIGLLLCKSKDHLVAQYALSDVNKPIGVSAYELGKMLPSVEQLENELNDFGGDND